MKRVKALVEPSVLAWARRSAGLSEVQAAKKAKVREEALRQWEAGDDRPSIPQLRNLAEAYRRPLAVFYLAEPPRDFAPMRDFRRLPGDVAPHDSPELLLEIRRAQDRRESAIDLYELLGETPPTFGLRLRQSDPVVEAAARLRDFLGVTDQDQVRAGPRNRAYTLWRKAVEASGVLVFQAPRIAIEETRGFSLAESPVPVIVLNSADSLTGRTFTLLHEVVHVALRVGGICTAEEPSRLPPEQRGVEIYCNAVAGETLVPGRLLLAEARVARVQTRLYEWPDETIAALARRYGVSREALLRRLLDLRRTTSDFYQQKRRIYAQQAAARRREKEEAPSDGGPTPERVAISRAGETFTNLVFEGLHQRLLTSLDVADHLDVGVKTVRRLQGTMFSELGEP